MSIDSSTVVIGRVSGKSSNSAWITPLRIFSTDGWEEAEAIDFPPDGDIFWVAARPDIKPDDIVAIRVRRGTEKHRWVTDVELDCHQLIDCRRLSFAALMSHWHRDPLRHSRTFIQGGATYVLCSDSLVLGPVPVEYRGPEIVLRNHTLHAVPAIRDAATIADLKQHGLWFVKSSLASESFSTDCRSDVEIMRSALTDARSVLTGMGPNLPATLATKRTIALAIEKSSKGSLDAAKIERLDRAQQVVRRWDDVRLRASDLETELLAIPSIADLLEHEVSAAADAAYDEARHAYSAENSREQERIATLRSETANLQAQANALNHDLDRADSIVHARVKEMTEDAADVVANSVVLRALSSIGGGKSTRQLAPIRFGAEIDAPIERSTSVFERVSVYKNPGRKVLEHIHAAVSAGLVPIVIGVESRDALATYARVAFADRSLEITVGHDFLQPIDLLGVRAETGDADRPNEGILLSANREVSADQPGLVILEGFNRGPTGSYLAPWLSNPAGSIEIPPRVQEALGQPSFVRNPHLAIAATAISCPTAAPVGPELWSRAAVIDASRWRPLDLLPAQPSFASTDVAPPSSGGHKFTKRTMDGAEDIAKDWWQIDTSVLRAGERLAHALGQPAFAEHNAGKARIAVAECLLLPAVATTVSDSELSAFVNSLIGWTTHSDERYETELLRRGRRIRSVLG